MSRPYEPELALPPENEPGHHPPKEQDKPDLDKFAQKLGADPKKAPKAPSVRKAPRPKAPPAKKAPSPGPAEAAHIAAPQPELEGEREPLLVGIVMLPLRQAVKGLEQLDRTLSVRLTRKLRARGGRGPRGR